MAKKKPIVSPLGQWAYPGEVTIIPSNSITMKGVNYPVLGIDNLGNQKVMMPGVDYTFPGDYVTEIPQMGKGGLTQWFAEKWTDIKTGKPCGRSGKEKGSRPYPACRPKNRVNETTPKTTSEMSSAEKARFKREKTSGKRIDYNHKRRQDGGENWLDQYQGGGWFTNFIASNPQLATNLFSTAKAAGKVAEKVGDVSKQQMFERYRPVDYPDVIGAIWNSGKDVPLRDLEGDYHVSEEAWRLALGLPTKSKYISPSKYKPSKANDPNAQYYSLNNIYDPQKLIDAYIKKAEGKPGQTVQMNSLSPYVINQDAVTTDNEIPFDQTDPLQYFTLSQGKDDKGSYVSLYDKYDFDLPLMDQVVYGSNRKPFEFYDRFYYKKDANGRPVYVKQKKNGGWLNKYQTAGEFSDSSNYSYDKDGNLIYTNYPFNFINDNHVEDFINDKLELRGTKKPLNKYETDFLENAKNKIKKLDSEPQYYDFQVSTQVDKLNPTLEELINVTQNTYPDQYAIDNSFSKASKSNSKINLPTSAFEKDIQERYVIPNALKNSINKSFGTLPTTQDEGYSPNRIWTTKVKGDEESGVGAGFTKSGDYAYILTPNSKKTSDLSKEKINTKKEGIENSLSSIDNKFYEDVYMAYPDYLQYPGNYNNPEISLFGNIKNRLPNQMWNRAEQMRVEMMNNPEIKDWADLHNLNLSKENKDFKENLVIDEFAPKVPESVYANRLVKAGLPVSTPDYNYGYNDTYIVQEPSKFNLAGYFQIPEYYNDENAKEFIAKKLGIKQEQLNNKDYLIHYNKSPITEYTPGKKYGGWLDQFQTGGYRYIPPSQRALTFQSSNPSTTDNTRANIIDPAVKKAAEAAQYARRVGSISQGTPKSNYQKAKEASSFVEREKQRTGSASPISYVLDVVNPATYGFAATDLVGNTASAVDRKSHV